MAPWCKSYWAGALPARGNSVEPCARFHRQVAALLDTGAETTCVDCELIRQLGLPFAGTVAANLPAHGGLTFATLHDASLTVLHPSGYSRDHLVVLNVTVLDISVSSLGYRALLGRDVLARCGFLYNGPNNTFRVAY